MQYTMQDKNPKFVVDAMASETAAPVAPPSAKAATAAPQAATIFAALRDRLAKEAALANEVGAILRFCVTEPDAAQKVLLSRLGLSLPRRLRRLDGESSAPM